MNQYIIVETVFGKEYKIAMLSHRFIGEPMYMLLADTYYLGVSIENPGKSVRNLYTSYEAAEKAVIDLKSPQIDCEVDDETVYYLGE